jgi:hypothetical protein
MLYFVFVILNRHCRLTITAAMAPALLNRRVESKIKQKGKKDMPFTFGYSSEIRVKMEKKTSIWSLVAIGALIVVALILFSFDDVYEPPSINGLTFNTPECSASLHANVEFDLDFGNQVEQSTWRPGVIIN